MMPLLSQPAFIKLLTLVTAVKFMPSLAGTQLGKLAASRLLEYSGLIAKLRTMASQISIRELCLAVIDDMWFSTPPRLLTLT